MKSRYWTVSIAVPSVPSYKHVATPPEEGGKLPIVSPSQVVHTYIYI